MRRVATLLVFLVATGDPDPLSGQQLPGYVLITEPVEWRGEGTRGILVREKRSIRVVGEASHPSGITRVLIDGTEASLDPMDARGVRFVGYAHPGPTTDRVEVAAYPRDGVPIIRTYNFALQAAETAYDTPAEAWGSGGFDGERYAVVVGVSEYRDPTITPLAYADDDAQLFYDFLLSTKAGLGGFKPENVRFLLNEEADARSLSTALSGFLRGVTERDVVVFYFAGHGAPDPYALEEYYFLTHDTDGTDIAGTAFPMSEVYDRIRRLRARDVIVIADACHSAAVSSHLASRAITNNDINGAFLERLQTTAAGKLILTAAETNQLSFEDARWGGGHGVFTWHVVQGLEGRADVDRDGIVTLHEMVEYARRRVQEDTRNLQIPAIAGQFDRSWPMAVAAVPAEEAEVTAEVEVPAVGAGPGGVSPPATRPTAGVEVDLISPAGAFFQSVLIPGTGQMRTGRWLRGVLVLGGVAGAGAVAWMSRPITRICSGPPNAVTGDCYAGEFVRDEARWVTERWAPAAIAGGALVLIGALDALFGARELNQERLLAAGIVETPGGEIALLPRSPSTIARGGDVTLLRLTHR